jgi:alkylation response protein AidB-like acyl-CoA dehydrogenase
LSDEEKEMRAKLRKELETNVLPNINYYYDKTTFPEEFLETMRNLGLGGATIKGHRSMVLSPLMTGIVLMELFRIDPSLGTFYFVHNLVALATINILGSENQKEKYIPDGCRFKNVYSFGLTEPSNGSDASNLSTVAEKTAGGYIINGTKRWIGNATHAKAIIIWAKLEGTNEIRGFIVEKWNPRNDVKKR